MSRWIGIPLAVGTAIFNWWIFYKIAEHYHSINPFFIANILMLAIVLHEIGHLVVMEKNGIKTHLIFLVILGGAITDPKYAKKLKVLPWSTLAAIYIAGVTTNVLMVLCSFILQQMGYLTSGQLAQIVNLNGCLILYNLLPFWIVDGGRFTKILFDSISEDRDFGFAIKIAATVGIIAIMASVLSLRNFILTAWLIFWGLHFKANHDDPQGSFSSRAMTRRQQSNWAIYYIILISIGIIFLAITKTWMA